jgi:hypothetical protein
MSDETKEKRHHEEHHPHHPHKHEHHGHSDEDRGIHMGWFFVIGAILLALVVLGWTMNM